MDEYGRMEPHRHRKAGMTGKLAMIGVVIAIILVAGFAYYFLGGPININGPTKLTVNGQGTVFSLGGKSYVATLASYDNNTQTAYVYMSAVPVFLGPLLNVTLHPNSTVKVNYGGQYAIMQVTLISGSKGSAQIQIDPLPLSLQVSPDYQYIGHPNITLPGLQITVTTTVAATTTVSGGSGNTVTTSSTVGSTTTAQQVNYTQLAIKAAVKDDENYALMLNFSTLYNATPSCTSLVYNNSYFTQFHAAPQVPLDYANVSLETPYALTQQIVSTGGNSYLVEFIPSVSDPNFNGVAALSIGLTVASAGTSSALAIVETNTYGGIFQGLAYSDLSSLYQKSASINNACAAMVG
jgi:hypothetical protein